MDGASRVEGPGAVPAAPQKYVPPHLRNKQADGAGTAPSQGQSHVAHNDVATASGGGHTSNQHRGGGASNGFRNQQGAVHNRASSLQQSGMSSGHQRQVNTRPSATGTGWDVRDGRRYLTEKEADVFSSDKMQSTGIKFDSYDKVPVDLQGSGSNLIVPIDSFQAVGSAFNKLLMDNVSRVKYSKPTPIQKNSIPTILAGRDLMACAQTGSGKTAAFLFPILARMLQQGPPQYPSHATSSGFPRKMPAYPVCLVLSPTRELAMQIYEEARKFQFGTGVRTVAVYGGSDVKRQLADLDSGCDICVATPGRLVDLLERKKVRLGLVQFLVLDEADRMLDMGFLPQIKVIVEGFDMPPCAAPGSPHIGVSGRPLGRQTVMFSATFPREIQMLAKEFLEDYIYLAVGRVGSTNEFIRQRLQYADEDQKVKLLVKLLQEAEKGLVIIFVETKRKADMIEDYLIEEDFPACSIHGDRTQTEREEALRYFKAGERPILVATDVAARGLDISNVTHVINYDLPTNIDDYVHRIGRTGRAGNLGLATSFVNEHNKPILRDLLNLLEEAKQEVPSFLLSLVMNCTSSMRMGKGGMMSGNARSGGRSVGSMGGGNSSGRMGGMYSGSMIGSSGRSLGSGSTGGGSSSMGGGSGRMGGSGDWRAAEAGRAGGSSRPAGTGFSSTVIGDRVDAW